MPKKSKLNINKKIIITIAVCLVIIIPIIVYFLFINPNTKINKNSNEDSEVVDPDFAWVQENEDNEVDGFDFYTFQDTLWKVIQTEYNQLKPSFDDPLIIVDPFASSPQTALVLFNSDIEEKIEVTIKGKHNDDITRTFEATKDHYIPIYGLYGGYENKVILKTESGRTKELTIKIDDTYSEGNVEVVKNSGTNDNGEFYFGTSSLGASTIAYDSYGEVRWYLTPTYSKGMTMLSNGHILLGAYSNGPDSASSGGVVELDMLGRIYHEYYLEGGYHHDGYEMPNGNLLLLTSNDGYTSGDEVVELDRESGQVVKDFDLSDIVSKIDSNITNYPTWSWINSVYYDANNKALILSVRNMNSIVSIDYDTSNINWILGDEKYWGSAFDSYILKGVGNNFSYTLGNHSVSMDENGYLSVFDNGYNAFRESTQSCASLKNNASYAKIYKINANDKTAELVWSYGGQELFSYALSSFNYTSSGNKVINSGWNFTDDVNYDDPNCTQFNNYLYESFIIELDSNNNIVNELRIDSSKFEVVKDDIYNLASNSVNKTTLDVIPNYSVSEIKVSNTRNNTYTELSREEALSYKQNNKMDYALVNNNGYVSANLSLSSDHEISFIFISASGKAYKFLYRAKDSYTTTDAYIYDLPKGKYHVYVLDNDTIYDSLQYVNVQ